MEKSTGFDETEKERIAFKIKTRNKNLPGDYALDFVFTDKNGNQHQLSDYKDRKVILYFYDPDCDNCHRISAWLDKQTIPADYTFYPYMPTHASATAIAWKPCLPFIYLTRGTK